MDARNLWLLPRLLWLHLSGAGSVGDSEVDVVVASGVEEGVVAASGEAAEAGSLVEVAVASSRAARTVATVTALGK